MSVKSVVRDFFNNMWRSCKRDRVMCIAISILLLNYIFLLSAFRIIRVKGPTIDEQIIGVLNEIGNNSASATFDMVLKGLRGTDMDEQTLISILEHMDKVYQLIQRKYKERELKNNLIVGASSGVDLDNRNSSTKIGLSTRSKKSSEGRIRINVATIACGNRTEEVTVMLKTAALFSQDAALHVILFSDNVALLQNAQNMLELKWTANTLGWDLTFELHLTSFPDGDPLVWKNMFMQCATQRLFFPTVLPHIDSLIYLDSDLLVVSNLTELWLEFSRKMVGGKIAALAPNNEPTFEGWYTWLTDKKIPYYGQKGLNAGVMLMNLTEMRAFQFQEKAIAANKLYREKIQLADQDIINIISAGFPEKTGVLNCTYNFNWVHCGMFDFECLVNGTNKCFCSTVTKTGIQIIHGNGGSFHTIHDPRLKFLFDIYKTFEKLDLLKDSYLEFFNGLRKKFNSSYKPKPCHPLTDDHLYRNAEDYFKKLNRRVLRTTKTPF